MNTISKFQIDYVKYKVSVAIDWYSEVLYHHTWLS